MWGLWSIWPDGREWRPVVSSFRSGQAFHFLTQLSNGFERRENQLYYLVRVDKARFTRTVVPGDQLKLEVMQKRLIRRMGLYECRALVGDQEVASAEILCAAPESSA